MRGKRTRRKQKGGSNNNNNNNNNNLYNNNQHIIYKNNNYANNGNQELIEKLAKGDLKWLKEQFETYNFSPTMDYQYTFPSQWNQTRNITLRATIAAYLAGMGIFEYHTTTEPSKHKVEDLLELCLDYGADVLGDRIKDITFGPAHFQSGEYSALSLFMAKRFDTCVILCVKKLMENGKWNDDLINSYIKELYSMKDDNIISRQHTFPDNDTIEYWDIKLRTMSKNIQLFNPLDKRRVLNELYDWKYRWPTSEKYNYIQKIRKGEISFNDAEFQEWLGRPCHDSVLKKWMMKKLIKRQVGKKSTRKNNNNYGASLGQMFESKNNVFVE